jgi:hypothetical protein
VTHETSHKRTFLGAAAAAAIQAFLWGRVQFWAAVAGATVLAVVLAFVAARRFRGTDFSFRLRITSAWSLIALLSILCFAPIRAGAIPDRTLERGVIAVLAFIALLAMLMALRAALGEAMRRPRFRRPALFLLGALLLALVAADLMQWVKPSGLSALACTPALFRGNPDTVRLLDLHRDAITQQAALHELPSALVAAVIVDHQNQQSLSGNLSDCVGSAVNVNLSLGLAQMRLSTAAQNDGNLLSDLSASEYRQLRSRLLKPESNIAYAARELRALKERAIRFPGMPASELLHNPEAMALLISEYRMGRMPTAAARSRLSINAFSTLGLMQDGTLAQFDRPDENPELARSRIRAYLSQIYCQSDMFNESACGDWLRSDLH